MGRERDVRHRVRRVLGALAAVVVLAGVGAASARADYTEVYADAYTELPSGDSRGSSYGWEGFYSDRTSIALSPGTCCYSLTLAFIDTNYHWVRSGEAVTDAWTLYANEWFATVKKAMCKNTSFTTLYVFCTVHWVGTCPGCSGPSS
jgi:hypothetical protein